MSFAAHLALHLHGAQSSAARHSVVFVHLLLTEPLHSTHSPSSRGSAALIRLGLAPLDALLLSVQVKAAQTRLTGGSPDSTLFSFLLVEHRRRRLSVESVPKLRYPPVLPCPV